MPFIGNNQNEKKEYEKSAYQQNVSQPIEIDKPVQSARQETLGKIYKIAETNPEQARNLYGLYAESCRTPGTPVYNQYAQPTNQAVGELAKYGINANGMTTDWFKNNNSWQQYLIYNGTTNTPSKPGKKSSANEWKAYWTYQIYKSAEDTDKAEREWAALKQEISWKAKNPGRNDSDDEIINGIDWKKYPTLAKMQETEGINPVELNRGIGFSKDDMYGVAWAARNGYEGDNSDYAIAMGALGQGNVWQENAELRAKLNWNNRDTYSPYSAGMTLGSDVGMYFNMISFNADDIERLRQTIDPNDATAVAMFDRVCGAWENTQKAEAELKTLEDKVDRWIKQGKTKDTIIKLTEKHIDNNCPTLTKMDESIQNGSKLVETTKAINYKKQDFLAEVGKYCDEAGTKLKGEQFVADIEKDAAPVSAEPKTSGKAPAAPATPKLTEQEKAIIAEQDKALADAGTIVDEVGTPVEKTASVYSWSATFDAMKNAVQRVRDSFTGQANGLIKSAVKSSISDTANAILTGSEVIASYEQGAAKLDEINKRCAELEASLGDLIYSGMNESSFSRGSVEVNVDGVPRIVRAEFNNRTGEYEITSIARKDGVKVAADSETYNKVMAEAQKRFASVKETRDRAMSVAGVAMSEEEKAMLDEYNKLSSQRNSLVQAQNENTAAYNEAKDKQIAAEAKRTAVISMMEKAGVPAEELKVFEETGAVIDVLNGFTQYDPTVWESFNAYDLYAQAIAFEGADSYDKVFADAKEGDAKNRQELETALWILDYSERNGIDVPENIKGNINRYIAKLERDHKDFEYFSVLQNKDFKEMAQRGRERVDAAGWDWGSFDGTIESQPAWSMLSDEQKDQLLGMMDTYDINDIAATFENMVANNAGDPVEDRLFGLFQAGNLMSNYEIDTYYYLLAKEGQEAADAYYNHLADSSYGALTVRSRDALEAGAKDLADQGFWGRRAADALSVIQAPAAAFGSFAYGVEYGVKKLAGQEVEYNPNNPWLSFNQFRTAARAEIQAEITRTYGEGSVAEKIFSTMQEIISNRGDSMMNMMAFGWLTNGMTSEMAQEFIGALPMAAGAAADVMAQAKERGASDTQAWMVGSIALLCEAGTEAISISNIKDAFKAGEEVTANTVREFLKNWVTEAGWSEAIGESLNDFFENAADEAFMGPLSEHARRVAELKEADPNMSDEEAEAQARREEFSSILHTAITSFLSPGMDVIPLAAGRVNYLRAQTKFAQKHGANVNILDVMKADKTIREQGNTAAANEVPETMPAATEQAEASEAAETAEAPQEEAEENADTTASEEERKQTNEQRIAADYTALDKSKNADTKSQTATLAAVLDIEGTDVSNDISKAVATKLHDFLQDTFGGKAQNAVEWVQDLLLGASEGNVDASALKQAITNMVLGGMDSAAYQELYNDKVGGLTEEFSTAELDHQAQRLAATVEQDTANADLQETIGKNVRESRVAEAEGRLISDGGRTLLGSDLVKAKLTAAQKAQATADRSTKALDNAQKTLEARQRAMEASAEAVQKASENLRNDPSDQNRKAFVAALSKHESNVTVYEQSQMEVENTTEANNAATEANRVAQTEVIETVRKAAEQLVAQEDQQRQQAAEQQKIEQEQQIEQERMAQEEEDRVTGKAEEDRQNAAIEQAVADENLEAEQAEERTEALKERRDAIVEGNVDLNGKLTNAEGMLAIHAFERKTGIKIQFADLPENVRGKYQNGMIFLNQNRVQSGKMLVGQALVEASLHEITHAMENTNSYKNYRNVVAGILFGDSDANYDNNAKYRAAIDAKISEYRNGIGQELTREQAEQEIIADFARLNLAKKETIQRFMDAGMGGKMRNVLHNINEALKNFIGRLTGEDRQIAENLRKAERAFQKALNEVAKKATHPEAEQFSVMQFAQSTGMTFNDKTLQLFDKDGNEVDGVNNKVTTEMISKTPVGMLIDSGLTGEQNAKAKEMMAGLMNMVARYKDSNLVWEIGATTLSSTFSALKSNSDPQYKTTVDFGTVCAKTQAIIDTMSQVMLDRVKEGKNGGLTRKDIMKVYNAVNKAGLSVPCPVCYVFSRWMGVPSLLGQMSQYQHDFVVTDKDGKIDKAATQKKVDAYLKNAQDTYGDAKAINNQKTKLQNKRSALEEKRVELDVQSRNTKLTKEQRKEIKQQLNDVLDQMVDLDKQIGEVSAYNWITQALCKKDKNTGKFVVDDKFRVTPDEVLFDLNRTGDFAKDEKNWRYRNTRGAGMGKAIMPYSGETIGDILYGVKAKGRQIKNPWLNMDEKSAMRQLKDAQKRARQQNLVGGQRLQSTSDFRPEWGLDYIMSFLELQAAKSKVQMYTKVAGAVDFFASVGADVNLSIMGKGTGWHEATAEELSSMTEEQKEQATVNGKVYVMDFSDVTGMKYGTARDLKNKYDNVQMILVGMNDTHIRLALKNSDIDFVIPWHSSGNSKDVLAGLIKSVGEKLDSSVDYTTTQTDMVKGTSKKYTDENGNKLEYTAPGERTEEQKALWDARIKLLTKGDKELTQADREVLLSNPITKELYRRFTEKGYDDDCYGVKLNKDQANQIFPYEYWDTSSTKDTADENGKRFVDYCEAMGIVPRFSQFKDDPGYWKLLIDRPMYNNDGSYHQQQTIDVTNAKIGDLNEEGQLTDSDIPTKAQAKYAPKDPRSENYNEYTEAQKNAIEYAEAALGDKQYDDGTEGQYSVYGNEMTEADMELLDDDYMDAVESGDTETAQKMVDFAAAQAGYTDKAYHGTNSFGFTEFNGGGYTFVSYDPSMAGTYSASGENIRNSNEGMRVAFRDMSNQQIVDYLNAMSDDRKQAFKSEGYSFVNAELDEDGDIRINLEDGYGDTFTHDEFVSYALNEEPFISENSGVYALYTKPGKQLVIDAHGDSWNGIHYIPEGMENYFEADKIKKELGLTTEEIATIAENSGYDSVRINNVYDHGRWNVGNGIGDIGIFFKQDDVKSADTVTYDDNGNAIPLDQRFTKSPDIRYSAEGEMTDADRDIDRVLVESGVLSEKELNRLNLSDRGEGERQFNTVTSQKSDVFNERALQYLKDHNHYVKDTNSAELARAIQWINTNATEEDPTGYQKSLGMVTSPSFNSLTKDGQAMMVAMLGMAAAQGNTHDQVLLLRNYGKQGTNIAQALQARKLFSLMTPEGRMRAIDRVLANAAEGMKKGKKDIQLEFSDWVYRAAAAAESPQDFDRVRQAAMNELAEQIPASWKDRVRSIRMLSMLANPRTHIRNIIGNALFVPAVSMKNKLGAVMELGVKRGNKTKTLALRVPGEIRSFAKEIAKEQKGMLTGEAKYNEATVIKKAQSKLGGFLDALSTFNSNALEAEDWLFLKGHFTRSFGGWMQANKYTVDQVRNDQALMEKGVTYAIEEAQKATYRDFNKAASILNDASRKGGAVGFLVDAALPFKKTPANILRRGIEYSPVGIVKSLTVDMIRMKKGDLTPTQVLDHFCAGLSGTAITALGFLLAGSGMVSCGLNDDEDKLEKAKGAQEYAVNLGKVGNAVAEMLGAPKLFGEDVTFTMDWAAPMAMPFFVGAAIREQMEQGGEFDTDAVINAFGNITEPVFNLSMLDGVNTLFKTSQYDDTNTITQIGAKVLTNYATSYVPSVLGAISRTFFDDKQRKAFVKQGEGNGPMGTVRYAIEQAENKIPGLAQTNIAVRDIWGREKTTGLLERILENFILPGYISKIEDDPIINEMGRLYDATGDAGMIPKEDPEKKISWTKDKVKHEHVLTAEEWDKYKEVRNGTAHAELTELINNPDYQNATDDVRTKMIKDVWSHAGDVGKNALFPEYELTSKDVKSIAKDSKLASYKEEIIKALDAENYDAYDTMVEAIRAEYDDEAEADATIKTKLGNTYRDKWKDAYKNGDDARMLEIEDILEYTGFNFNIYGKGGWQEKVDDQ